MYVCSFSPIFLLTERRQHFKKKDDPSIFMHISNRVYLLQWSLNAKIHFHGDKKKKLKYLQDQYAIIGPKKRDKVACWESPNWRRPLCYEKQETCCNTLLLKLYLFLPILLNFFLTVNCFIYNYCISKCAEVLRHQLKLTWCKKWFTSPKTCSARSR